jgi:hypothetical protein
MRITALCGLTLYSLVGSHHSSSLKKEAASSYETLILSTGLYCDIWAVSITIDGCP